MAGHEMGELILLKARIADLIEAYNSLEIERDGLKHENSNLNSELNNRGQEIDDLNVDFNRIVNNDVFFDKNKNDFFKLFSENRSNIYSELEIKEAIEICDDEIVIALDSGELSFEQDEYLMIIAQHISCNELVKTVVDIIDRNANDYIFLINCIQDIVLFGQVLDNCKVKKLLLLFLSFNINKFDSWFYSCDMNDADSVKFTLYLEQEFLKMNELEMSVPEQKNLH